MDAHRRAYGDGFEVSDVERAGYTAHESGVSFERGSWIKGGGEGAYSQKPGWARGQRAVVVHISEGI